MVAFDATIIVDDEEDPINEQEHDENDDESIVPIDQHRQSDGLTSNDQNDDTRSRQRH